jgi:S1-C subfamily serine protease
VALVFLASVVGSFLLGRATAENDTVEGAQPAPTAQPRVTEAPAGPTTTVPGPVDPGSSVEPIPAVADAVSPSVVQISVNLGNGTGSLGSGFLYDNDGRILTNAHVVGDAPEVTVRLSTGTQITGTVVGADETSDVAVVRVDPEEIEGLQPATLALNVEVRRGQTAIALGSPFGLEQSVTAGIISAVNRPVQIDQQSPPQSMHQTDAAINTGNSGGVLADLQGRVVGINSAIFSQSGGNDGVGFAIPIDRAVDIAGRLERGEEINRGLLGVTGVSPDAGRAGGLITEVTADSAADVAGLQPGDLVVGIDDDEVRSFQELGAIIRARDEGSQVDVHYVRDGREWTVQVILGSE